MKFLIRLEIIKNGSNWTKTFDCLVIGVKNSLIYVLLQCTKYRAILLFSVVVVNFIFYLFFYFIYFLKLK